MQIRLTLIDQLARELGCSEANSRGRNWLVTVGITPVPGRRGCHDLPPATKRVPECSRRFYKVMDRSDRSKDPNSPVDARAKILGSAFLAHDAGAGWISDGEPGFLSIFSGRTGSSASRSDKKHQVELALHLRGSLHHPRIRIKASEIPANRKILHRRASSVQAIRLQIADNDEETVGDPIMDRNAAWAANEKLGGTYAMGLIPKFSTIGKATEELDVPKEARNAAT
jgi:hypothetical protein